MIMALLAGDKALALWILDASAILFSSLSFLLQTTPVTVRNLGLRGPRGAARRIVFPGPDEYHVSRIRLPNSANVRAPAAD